LSEGTPCTINLDEAFGFLRLVDVRELAGAVEDRWHNQTLCRINDCIVRLGVMQGSSTGTTTIRRTSSSMW